MQVFQEFITKELDKFKSRISLKIKVIFLSFVNLYAAQKSEQLKYL